MSIYKKMEEDWETYCLMSGIAFIEEFSKPKRNLQVKDGRNYWCYGPMQLRINNRDIIHRWLKITRIWERKLGEGFITSHYSKPKKEKGNKKWCINFLPNWLYHVTKTIGKFPSSHVNEKVFDRLKNWKFGGNYKQKYILTSRQIDSLINSRKNLYKKLLTNKMLATGAFIVSFDFEFRGLTVGRPNLSMASRYKDFLDFMLRIANKWKWATNGELYKTNMEYSRKMGINASDQYNFTIKSKKLNEIYRLAGPVLDKHKDRCIKFHISRSKNFVSRGTSKYTKFKILRRLEKLKYAKSTELQFEAGIGIDVILQHLNNFYKKGIINKERKGKYYLWSIKNANKCRHTLSESRRRVL
jgi:DNA-binding transcriptional ArsR family regulator